MENTQRSLLVRLNTSPDEPSWGRMVQLYTPFLQRALRAEGVCEADLQDVLQDVFVVVVREMPGFAHSGRTGAFRYWLRSIMGNCLRRHWQQKKSVRQMQQDPSEPSALEQLAISDDELNQIWDREHNQWITNRLLELIEPEFRTTTWQAFVRLVVEMGRPSEVAKELGLSVNAVLIAKSRVLRRLRQEIDGLVDEVDL